MLGCLVAWLFGWLVGLLLMFLLSGCGGTPHLPQRSKKQRNSEPKMSTQPLPNGFSKWVCLFCSLCPFWGWLQASQREAHAMETPYLNPHPNRASLLFQFVGFLVRFSLFLRGGGGGGKKSSFCPEHPPNRLVSKWRLLLWLRAAQSGGTG